MIDNLESTYNERGVGWRGGGSVFDHDGKEIKKFPGGEGPERHFANFIEAVRTRKSSILRAPDNHGSLAMYRQNAIALLFAALPALFLSAAARAGEKPNIIIIVADDLGWADVSFHGTEIKTPKIDSLAEAGAVLDRFYVCPVCSPTRAGLMTGRYPIRFGLMRAVLPPWRTGGMDTAEVTIADMLGEAGYAHRGVFGKWHLGHSSEKYHPLRRGFTEYIGHYNGAIDYFTH